MFWLPSQDRDLHKEAALSAQSRILLHTPAIAKQGKLPIPALPVAAYTTKQAKQRKKGLKKRNRQRELHWEKKRKKKESGNCGEVERREGMAKCKMHRDLASTTLTAAFRVQLSYEQNRSQQFVVWFTPHVYRKLLILIIKEFNITVL